MSKQGILLSVAENQEGEHPRIVTESEPLPTIAYSAAALLASIGQLWHGSHVFKGVANDADINVYLTTGAAAPTVVTNTLITSGTFEVWIYEGVTVSANGAAHDTPSVNRQILTNTLLSQAYINPTVTDTGLQLLHSWLPAGEKSRATTNDAETTSAFKANTNYLFVHTNRSGQAADGTITWTIGE